MKVAFELIEQKDIEDIDKLINKIEIILSQFGSNDEYYDILIETKFMLLDAKENLENLIN